MHLERGSRVAKRFLILLASLLAAGTVLAQPAHAGLDDLMEVLGGDVLIGTGLESQEYKKVQFNCSLEASNPRVVMDLDRLENKVEFLVRSAGLSVVEEGAELSLDVELDIVGHSYGIIINWYRYDAAFVYKKRIYLPKQPISVWSDHVTGIHHSDPDQVYAAVRTGVERALEAYLRANREASEPLIEPSE